MEKEEEEEEERKYEKLIIQKPLLYCIYDIESLKTSTNNNFMNNNNNPTIVLIGTNGIGKSTFGNWLFNYGLSGLKVDNFNDILEENYSDYINREMSKPFITSSEKKDSTKCCTEKVELYLFLNFNIIDTPGLNDPNDFENMERLIQFLLLYNNISSILLCLPYQLKFDDPTIDTIKYYEKLFKPIFREKQIIIVFTKVNNEDYLIAKEEEEWEESIKIKLSQLNNKFNSDFRIGFAFNTIYSEEDILNEIKNEKKSDNLIGESMRNRDMILTIIKSYKAISKFELLFSLPPAIERKRIEMMKASKIVSSTILELLGEEENRDKVNLLNRFNEYTTDYNENEKEKRKLEVFFR
jgi:hypothetical protein